MLALVVAVPLLPLLLQVPVGLPQLLLLLQHTQSTTLIHLLHGCRRFCQLSYHRLRQSISLKLVAFLDGEILQAASYHHLLASSQEFQDLVNAHEETAGPETLADATSAQSGISSKEIKKTYIVKQHRASCDWLIKQEERET
ncbi:hypothetical protein ACFXTO_006660 [Malus domestica]